MSCSSKDVFPSTTILTHVLWPSRVARLEHLGVLDRLNARHELPGFDFRIRRLGHEIAGGFTLVGALGRGVAPRRIALDQSGVEVARAAGAIAELDTRVVGLLGRGSTEDPVREKPLPMLGTGPAGLAKGSRAVLLARSPRRDCEPRAFPGSPRRDGQRSVRTPPAAWRSARCAVPRRGARAPRARAR